MSTLPPAPDDPDALRMCTSPPTLPSPLDKVSTPPMPPDFVVSPLRTDTVDPRSDEPTPATNTTSPADDDKLLPLAMRTDPEADDNDEPDSNATAPVATDKADADCTVTDDVPIAVNDPADDNEIAPASCPAPDEIDTEPAR